jgi:hypothetical protein
VAVDPPGAIPLPGPAPAALPPLVDEMLDSSWRLHWEADPTKARPHSAGKYRFDAPGGEYGVTYVNEDRFAPFAEAYGGHGVLARSEADRLWSCIRSTRRLRILQLDEEGIAARFGLDLRISTELDYTRTQAWSLAWHEWYSDIDGLRFIGRKALTHLNYCLFLDRCGKALKFTTEGRLVDLRADGLLACHRHGIVPELYF